MMAVGRPHVEVRANDVKVVELESLAGFVDGDHDFMKLFTGPDAGDFLVALRGHGGS